MTHALKTWPEYFKEVKDGKKRFELRLNDRGFKVGDKLLLQEFDPSTKKYTGEELEKQIDFIFDGFGLKKDYVVMSISDRPDYV